MKTPDLSRIDLNLLVVLDVLLREKSVTRTAAHLNLTSSAVSHSLKRLRLLFENELLVRDGRRMLPTARGQSLAEVLPSLLAQVQTTLAIPEPFDPVTSTRSFRICAPDFISSMLPHLIEVFVTAAPNASLQLSAYSPTAMLDMKQGRFDALIAPSARKKDDMRGEAIGAWPWMVYGRKDHPAFKEWSLKSWARFPHLQVSATTPSGQSPIDRKAIEGGVTRKIGATVTHFSMAPPILAQTDMLLTVPAVAMGTAAAAYGLQEQDLPLDQGPLELSLFRAATTGDQPEIIWLHKQIKAAAMALQDLNES